MADTKNSCCSCGPGCCGPAKQGLTETKDFVIDFLYLDLNVCSRCQGTDKVLDEAVSDVFGVLKAAGYDVVVNKINITTMELAIQHEFVSSPTIRVNGYDIDVDVKETLCESCGDLCGDNVDCRVWTYKGVEYNTPPKALIVDALLREAYGSPVRPAKTDYVLPHNLEVYFEAMQRKGE